MLTENLAVLFERDIRKLKIEINAYASESLLWEVAPGIANSGGNLCLHLLGNLQHFIGAILGKSGYIRNRPEEFSQKNIPLAEINQTLDHVIDLVPKTIRSVSPELLSTEYPEKVFDHSMTTEYFLLHLLAHLNYHLGQINYHRRILSGI
ncbi:MAG: DinB family protein [Bacteroidota bacterium]